MLILKLNNLKFLLLIIKNKLNINNKTLSITHFNPSIFWYIDFRIFGNVLVLIQYLSKAQFFVLI